MSFHMKGIRDNIYPNDPMLKEKAMTIKKTFRVVALMASVYQMGG